MNNNVYTYITLLLQKQCKDKHINAHLKFLTVRLDNYSHFHDGAAINVKGQEGVSASKIPCFLNITSRVIWCTESY